VLGAKYGMNRSRVREGGHMDSSWWKEVGGIRRQNM